MQGALNRQQHPEMELMVEVREFIGRINEACH